MYPYILVTGKTSSDAVPPQVLVVNEHERALVNVGDNTQRFAAEHHLKLSKCEDIFLTRLDSSSLGGLPGLLLTLEACEIPPNMVVQDDDSTGNPSSRSKKKRKGHHRADGTKTPNDRCCVSDDWVAVQKPKLRGFAGSVQTLWFRQFRKNEESDANDTNPLLPETSEGSINMECSEAESDLWSSPNLSVLKSHMKSLSGGGISTVRLWGPSGLHTYVSCVIQRFAKLRFLDIQIYEFGLSTNDQLIRLPSVIFNMETFGIVTEASCSGPSVVTDGESSGAPASECRVSKSRRIDGSSSGSSGFESVRDGESYIPVLMGRSSKQQGKFDVTKAKALGIPPGPLYGKLKNGESVTSPSDGRLIDASEVCGPPIAGVHWIILDIRDEEYIYKLLIKNIDRIRDYMIMSEDGNNTTDMKMRTSSSFCPFIIYLTSITSHRIHQIFENDIFHNKCNQIQLSENTNYHHSNSPFVSLSSLTSFINQHCPYLYSFANSRSSSGTTVPTVLLSQLSLNRKTTDSASILPWSPTQTYQEKLDKFASCANKYCPQHIDTLQQLSTAIANIQPQLSGDAGPRLCLLGTGAAIPSKFRNASSTLLQIHSDTCILLDCGEGTTGQLFRLCSCDSQFHKLISSIAVVIISHIHADHHLGIFQLLELRRKFSVETTLTIVGPQKMKPWFQFLQNEFGVDLIEFLPLRQFLNGESQLQFTNTGCPVSVSLQSAEVFHIFKNVQCNGNTVKVPDESYGVRINVGEYGQMPAYSVTYSGDTRPCDSLITLAHESDILIHEATFADALAGEAINRNHCTFSEAVEVFAKSMAKTLVLTHFSQRYPTIPVKPKDDESNDVVHQLLTSDAEAPIIFGFDLMSLDIKKLIFCEEFRKCLFKCQTLLPDVMKSLKEALS